MTISFAPAGALRFLLSTHSLRCGLHSSAALRLKALGSAWRPPWLDVKEPALSRR